MSKKNQQNQLAKFVKEKAGILSMNFLEKFKAEKTVNAIELQLQKNRTSLQMPNPQNKITLTEAQTNFLKENWQTMTNKQLAAALGLNLTRTRTELYNLGLKRMELEYWTDQQIKYLRENFRRIGDKELAEIFNTKYPKQKSWKSHHIQKKMSYLGLKRNKLDWFLIKERNRENGSFGNKNHKNNPKPPQVYFHLDARTKIVLTPKTDVDSLKEKYENRNLAI